jgi:hypothetical protein
MLLSCHFRLRRWRYLAVTARSLSDCPPSGDPRLPERARMILVCVESADGNSGVAADLGLSAEIVRKWRGPFIRPGPGGSNCSAEPKVAATLEELPRDASTSRGPRWPAAAACRSPRSGRYGAALARRTAAVGPVWVSQGPPRAGPGAAVAQQERAQPLELRVLKRLT